MMMPWRYASTVSGGARKFIGLALALAALGAAPATALAGDPVIVPAPEADGIPNAPEVPACVPRAGFKNPGNPEPVWRTCLLPDRDAVVDWPYRMTQFTLPKDFWPDPLPGAEVRSNGFRTTRSFILPRPGLFALFLSETRSELGYPLIWYDAGSGLPVSPASGPWQFTLAGKYWWECLTCSTFTTERQKLQGTVYVIGPRAIMKAKLAAANNSGTDIPYEFDATGSFVVDYAAHSIVKYEFDFQDDGTYDVTNTEGTAQSTFTPGPHTIRVRVTDDTGRTGMWPMFLEVPYVRPGNPEPNPTADNAGKDNLSKGVKFAKTKIRLKAVKRIKVGTLRRKGLSVRVSGLSKGDRIRARLFKGKKTIVASGSGTTQKSVKTVRLRVTRKGRRTLAARPRRLVIDIGVEGTDGYTATKRVAVRVSY